MKKSRSSHIRRLLPLLLIMLLVLAGCRRDEEATPTAAVPAVQPEQTVTRPRPTATREEAQPTATPTSEPEAEQARIDPADIDWSPQLISSNPQRNEEVPLNSPITLRFDQPMDADSVEAAFALRSANEDEEQVPGAFQWPGSDTVVFTPARVLSRNHAYEVRIDAEARGRNGQALASPIELLFDTVGYLEVARVVPADGLEGVNPQSSISVLFNRPVVPLVGTGQQAELPQPLEISPTVEGSGEWVSTSVYRFTPEESLAGATSYDVTVVEGLEDVMGGVLEDAFSWSFTTAGPSVAAMIPESGSLDVIPTVPLTVTFNMPMDQASTEAAIGLEPAAAVSFDWSDENRTVTVEPDDMLQLGTRYTLSVDTGAQAANGTAALDRSTRTIFTTVPLPSVASTSPEDGEVASPYQYGIHIEFAAPIDPETIEGRIEINPAPEDNPNYFIQDRYVNVDFGLLRNTEYEVTIPGDVADPYGNTLGEAYTWRFRTPPPQPIASFNLPQSLSQLSNSSPTDIDIVYRNVSVLDVSLYEMELDPLLMLEPYRVGDMSAPGAPLDGWSIESEAAPNEAGVATVNLAGSEGGTLPVGLYYLRVNAPEIGEDVRYWQNQRVLLVVADTNLVVKEMTNAVHVWATDLASGEPAAGRDLQLYNANGTWVESAVTDDNGLASFNYQPPREYLPGVVVVSGQPGQPGFGVGSSSWSQGISPWSFNVEATGSAELPQLAYIYTDRPIYRPGDTVYYRGILRDANYARYDLPGPERVTVRVEFFSYYEGNEPQQYEVTLLVDENGTFNGEYLIPENAALGSYRLYLAEEGAIANASRQFTVAEYRAPEFQVSVTPQQEEVLRGESADVIVEARYFFGSPAADLEVEWNLFTRPYQLPWEGPYYSFTDDDNYYFVYGGPESGYYGDLIESGRGRTDAEGRLVVSLPADLLDEVDAGSQRVTLEATIRDLSEFPVAARGEVIYHAAETYVGVAPADYLNQVGEETAVNLVTVDWDGNPLPNQEVAITFYQRDYNYVRDDRFGSLFGRWEPEDTEVEQVAVTSNADGEAQAAFVPEDGGTYRAVATVSDASGRSHSSSTLFWVSGSEFVSWRVNPDEKRMDLKPDQRTYEVGDTARILVQSPFSGPVQAWLTIERGELMEQRIITLESNSDVVELPVSDLFSPNVFVTVVAIKGADEESPYADMRMGITELVVPPDQLTLNVELTPQSDLLSPGETVTYDIRVTDYTGQPVQADLSLALVDLAVLSLMEDNAPPIVDAFYHRQPYRSQLGSGLIISGEGLEVEIPQDIPGMGGGGGDGMATESARALDEEETEVRREFPDTAFWRANLLTDANGEASVDIPLPDSLTTWRLSTKAVTADSLVGQTSVDVVASLPLLVRPVTPRFFSVNDVVQIGAIVNNNTGEGLDVTVSLEADGLTLADAAEQEVTVAAGAQQLVRWQVTVEDIPFADLAFRASGGGYEDATKPTLGVGPEQLLPVYRYTGEDIVGTSGVLDEPGRQVEAILLPPEIDIRQGTADVRLTPSLAASLLETLDYVDSDLAEACAHGVVSSFLPNLAVANAFRELRLEEPELAGQLDALIRESIERLAQLQKADGGWGWCWSEKSDPYLTAYVLFGLATAQESGYSAMDIDVERALDLLEIRDPEEITSEYLANRQAWFLYVLAHWAAADPADLDALFSDDRDLLDPYATAYLALAYELAGESGNDNQQTLLADLDESVIVSASGAHWEDASRDWQNLSSDIRGTAVVLEALARLDPANPLAPGAVRWLMSASRASHWPTAFETSWSVLGLTEWMKASSELEANFDYRLSVNGRSVENGHFGEENLTEAVDVSLPLRRLLSQEPNFFIFEHGDGPGRLYYTAHMDAFINAEAVEPMSRGITVQRTYYDAGCDPLTTMCEPIEEITAGQRVRVEVTLIAPNDLTFVRLEDPLPAGTEAVDPGLQTSTSGLGGDVSREDEPERYGYWGWRYFDRIEYRDDKVVFYSSFLPAGTYQYSYFLDPLIPGEFQVRPPIAYQEFFPEVFGRGAGMLFAITAE